METLGLWISFGLLTISVAILAISIFLLKKVVQKINELVKYERKAVNLLREIRFNTLRVTSPFEEKTTPAETTVTEVQ